MIEPRKRATDEPFGCAIAALFGAGIVAFASEVARAIWNSLMGIWTP